MISKIFFYLTPILILFLGFSILGIPSTLPDSLNLPQCYVLFVAFLIFNLMAGLATQSLSQIVKIWTTNVSKNFFLGCLVGLISLAIASFVDLLQGNKISFITQDITVYGILVTLAIVSWEELWFRGIAFELAGQRYTKILASFIFSVLFVLVHAFNPNMKLIEEAPQLFTASLCLSLLYFYSGGIWAPIGMHFSNNYFESLIKIENIQNTKTHSITYVLSLTLIAVFLIFTITQEKK